jgi:hypothetical protein
MLFPIGTNSGTRGSARSKGGRRGPLCKEAEIAGRGVAENCHRRRFRNPAGLGLNHSQRPLLRQRPTGQACIPTPPDVNVQTAEFAPSNVLGAPAYLNDFVRRALAAERKRAI